MYEIDKTTREAIGKRKASDLEQALRWGEFADALAHGHEEDRAGSLEHLLGVDWGSILMEPEAAWDMARAYALELAYTTLRVVARANMEYPVLTTEDMGNLEDDLITPTDAPDVVVFLLRALGMDDYPGLYAACPPFGVEDSDFADHVGWWVKAAYALKRAKRVESHELEGEVLGLLLNGDADGAVDAVNAAVLDPEGR